MKWSLRNMALTPGIDSFLRGFASGKRIKKRSPRTHNHPCCAKNKALEDHTYNLYKAYPIERLKEMIRWREASLASLRHEIRGIGQPILNALRRALQHKQEYTNE